jgi:ATP-binding cassette subfamily F protein uup
VSTVVIGLDGGDRVGREGRAGVFADYSQWEASRNSRRETQTGSEAKPTEENGSGGGASDRASREPATGQQKKLSYIEQREWDGMERQILDSEKELARWEREVQQAASDAERLPEAYAKLQDAHKRVEELYARWAELESKVAG